MIRSRALMEFPDRPSVLVLLVATDGALWLPEVLRGLKAQKHRPIDILAVDNASTDATAEILSNALGERRVVSLDRRAGYGRALAVALRTATDRRLAADFFLLVHDDAELAPGAVAAMLEAMRRDGVGIVGAKLLDWAEPDRLQDIGQTADRYGRHVPRVERGELDQGQHDGIHEVLYSTSAAMLVSAAVVEDVGLFDPRYAVLRDDFDFCWRARLAGYRTVVTTTASARHASATMRNLRATPASNRVRYYSERNMIATLIKNYGGLHLALAVPMTVAISVMNILLFFITGRRASAIQVLEALEWNVVHLPSTLRARRRAQRARKTGDADITRLMHHGATRLRSQFERAVEVVVGDVDTGSEDDFDRPPPRMVDRARAHPGLASALLILAVVMLGARTLLFSGGIAGTDFAPFPSGAGDFFSAFWSGWRGAGYGGAAPATPGLAILGLLTMACGGSVWLAQRVLILGLPAIGVSGMFRLARALGLGSSGRRIATLAYAVSPLLLGAFGAGRLGDLVLIAAAPGILLALARAAGVAPRKGWRPAAAMVAGVALAASLSPWVLVFVVGAGAVFAISARGRARDVLALSATTVAGAVVLLFPWSLELFRSGSPLGSGGSDPPARMLDILALSPGAVRPLPVAIGISLTVAGALGFLMVPQERRPQARILGAIAIAAVIVGWAVVRGVPWIAPRASLPLAAASVALALLAGMGIESASRLGARQFGVAHLAVGTAVAMLLLQGVASAGWIAAGRHPGLVRAGTLVPSFIPAEEQTQGAFRILWVSGTASAPKVALSGARGTTMLSYLSRPAGAGDAALRRALAAIAGGATESGGRLLATLGVRYVIVRPEAGSTLADSFARQVDLAFSQRFTDSIVYKNQVGIPIAAGISTRGWILAGASGLDAAAGAEPTSGASAGFGRRSGARYVGSTTKATRQVLLAEDYSSQWRLRTGGKEIPPRRSFGWATRFVVSSAHREVEIIWVGQRFHRISALFQIAIMLAFAAWWSQRAARERGER